MIDALLWLVAEPACAPRDAVTAKLERQFGETPVSAGLADGERGIFSIYANGDTGTWTAVLIKVDGSACLIASGSNWGAMPESKKGEPT